MRTSLAITALIAIVIALALYAESLTQDATQPNRLAHGDGAILAVSFAHADHVEQTCVTCHHNYVDDTGSGMCFECHNTHEEVAHLVETQFHDLCRGCHEREQIAGNDHGPTRQCVDCHVKDDRP